MIRDVLRYFLPLFFLFLVIGFLNGWPQRPETVHQALYKDTHVMEERGRYYLRHKCREDWTYRFSVDDDDPRPEVRDLAAALKSTGFGAPSDEHMQYYNLLGAFLGGGAGGYNYRDLLRKPPPQTTWLQHARKTILGFLGAISGYSLGNWLGARYDTACDSALARRVLSKSDTWRRFEMDRLKLTLTELLYQRKPLLAPSGGRNLDPLADDPVFQCSAALKARVDRMADFLSREQANPGSAEFQAVDSVKSGYEKAKAAPEYATLVQMHKKGVFQKLAKEKAPELAGRLDYSKAKWDEACGTIQKLVM
jgi:hypothetical protein